MDKTNHDAHPVAATRRRGRYSCVCRREVLVRGLIGLFFHFSSLRFLAFSGWLLVIGLCHFAPVCQGKQARVGAGVFATEATESTERGGFSHEFSRISTNIWGIIWE